MQLAFQGYLLNKLLKMKQPCEPTLLAPDQPCFHKCEKCEVDLKPGCEECKKVQNDRRHCSKKQAVGIAKDRHGWWPEHRFLPVSRVWKVLNLQRCKNLLQSHRLRCEFTLPILRQTTDALQQERMHRSRPTL